MMLSSFPDKAVMAELLARMLWEIKAVHFRADQPISSPPAWRAQSISIAAS